MTAIVPGLLAVSLMLVWAIHDGGYDADTWYWGALAVLATLAVAVAALRGDVLYRRLRASRSATLAVSFFALYVAWSYLSIAWAQSPGDALEGSNRTLLYFLMFVLLLILPWTSEGVLTSLVTFSVGVGVIEIVLLVRLASADHIAALIQQGRLAAPTGYFNSTAALFTMGALTAVVLATRRELPRIIRAALIAFACSGFQLALIVQSRGWLFTLPIMGLAAIALVPDRLRVIAFTTIPVVAMLVVLDRLLHVYNSSPGRSQTDAAAGAGHGALSAVAGAFILGMLIAWVESVRRPKPMLLTSRRWLGTAVAVAAIAVAGVGIAKATHGNPFRFISKQWNGFSHPQRGASSGSHFGAVGSGRYDFWRVSLDALMAHPIGGLGQDNFADYYIPRRRTDEEPSWAHSLEMRLLAHTGFVGFGLFSAFLISAIASGIRARRGPPLTAAAAGGAMLPLVIWLIYGSVDWFWEIPALSGPALGFLGMAASLEIPMLAQPDGVSRKSVRKPTAWKRSLAAGAGAIALLSAILVLGLPYLSVREVSAGNDIGTRDPAAAFSDLKLASKLNPLSATPARLAGAIALQAGDFYTARQRFRQAISREPGGWFSWLGAGLAASALGDSNVASRDYRHALGINSVQPVVRAAVARVRTRHPLTSDEAFSMLVVVG